jgi:hypothetical protein
LETQFPHFNHVKQSKPDSEGQRSYVFPYIWDRVKERTWL